MELALRVLLALEIAAFFAIRLYFDPKHDDAQVTNKEHPAFVAVMSLVALGQVVSLVLSVLAPKWIAFAALPIPIEGRIAGGAIGAIGVGLLWWSTWSLGRNYSSLLHVRDDHERVTAGPYARVRHPIYTALYVTMAGLSVLSASWLVALTLVGGLSVIVVVRLPQEEQLMLDRFGGAYESYMTRTNRFLP